MTRFDYRAVSPKKRRELLDRLANIVATIRKEDEARYFVERLFTESEIVMFMRRLEVAEMLVSGLTYEQIRRKLKVGTSTIQAVDGWLTDAAYEYQQIRAYQKGVAQRAQNMRRHSEKLKRHRETTMPGTLRHMIRRDSRMILFRLLLGD
jgi:uncharacterized protein YerC